jgi:hypothetical protein
MNFPNNQPGGSSVSDILTTFKNNVIATNTIVTYLQGIYNNIATQRLFGGAATTSVSTLYSASSGVASHINTINICNTASAAATFSIYIVPSGGTASAANAVFYNCPIPANTTTLWSGALIIPAGGSIQASASATTVTFNMAGGNSV